MFECISDKTSKIVAMVQYVCTIIVIGVMGSIIVIKNPAQTNIYCSKNDDKCMISQQIFDVKIKKDEFNISSIASVIFDTPILGKVKSSDKLSVQYNMVVNFNDGTKPFIYVLSPREDMRVKIEDNEGLEKSKNFVNKFNEYLSNPNQSVFDFGFYDNMAVLLFVLFIVLFIISIIWPVVISKYRNTDIPPIQEYVIENEVPNNEICCIDEKKQSDERKLLFGIKNPKLELLGAVILFMFTVIFCIMKLKEEGIF